MASSSLSNEVWLEIFTRLNYLDLKKCERVSKSFKALVEHPALDKNTFRAGKLAIQENDYHSKLLAHPVFNDLSIKLGLWKLAGVRLTGQSGKSYDVPASVAAEPASVPPTSFAFLGIAMDDGDEAGNSGNWDCDFLCPDTEVRSKQSVTVRDVLEALAKRLEVNDIMNQAQQGG